MKVSYDQLYKKNSKSGYVPISFKDATAADNRALSPRSLVREELESFNEASICSRIDSMSARSPLLRELFLAKFAITKKPSNKAKTN